MMMINTCKAITTESEAAAAAETGMKAVKPQPQLKEFYCSQGSHSLAYNKIQHFSRTNKTFFQDSVVAQQC